MKSNSRILPQCLIVLVTVTAASLPAVAATDNGTLAVGHGIFGNCGGFPLVYSGYLSTPTPIGSILTYRLTGGRTVLHIYDTLPGCFNFSQLSVSNFSSNPGAAWLTSITCNGVTNSSGATFQYSAGVATWRWTQRFGFMNLAGGSNVSCTIVHN